MVFHWSLSDSKSLHVTRTLLSILADPDNTVVWMISISPLISNSTSLLSKPLGTVSSTLSTIGITATFIFSDSFNSQARSNNSSLFLFNFFFSLWSGATAKFTIRLFFFFFFFFFLLFTLTRSSHLAGIRWFKFQSLVQFPVDYL